MKGFIFIKVKIISYNYDFLDNLSKDFYTEDCFDKAHYL